MGIEPTIRVLQTRALPLGYVAAVFANPQFWLAPEPLNNSGATPPTRSTLLAFDLETARDRCARRPAPSWRLHLLERSTILRERGAGAPDGTDSTGGWEIVDAVD